MIKQTYHGQVYSIPIETIVWHFNDLLWAILHLIRGSLDFETNLTCILKPRHFLADKVAAQDDTK